jgi:hypothetical protein
MKSKLKWKFIDYRPHLAAVMPVQTGIQFFGTPGFRVALPRTRSGVARNDDFFLPRTSVLEYFLFFGETGNKARVFQLLHKTSID